jgi:small redox-active disulfide protein 2
MTIKILGSGCRNCVALKDNTEAALKELGLEAEIVKVTDFKDIMAYGVMSTPALVIDGEVKLTGRLPRKEELHKFLKDAAK